MSEDIFLIGAGSHGQDILSIWNETTPPRFVPGHVTPRGTLRLRDEHNPMYPPPLSNEGGPCYLGPYDGWTRAAMARRLTRYWGAEALVHPSSTPGVRCFLNPGVVVARNVVLDHDVHLGHHTHVNYCASMTRTKVGDFCTISPGVVICGDVTIGDRVFIGAGAVITNLITIGDDAKVGAGAVVIRDVPDGMIVTGVPARARR